MSPEASNDPVVLIVLAALALVAFAVQTYVMRPRGSQRSDSPRETTWRNRWH
jgi:hypothetical protein